MTAPLRLAMGSLAQVCALAYMPLAQQLSFAASRGWQVDLQLSNKNVLVLYLPVSRTAVVAFRGTHITNLADLGCDALVTVGLHGCSPRFRAAIQVVREAMQQYGESVVVTGHSLGGSQALHANRKLGVESHTFNPGAGPWTAIKEATLVWLRPDSRRAQNARRSTVYTTGWDPISLCATSGPDRKVVIRPNRLNVHALANFLG